MIWFSLPLLLASNPAAAPDTCETATPVRAAQFRDFYIKGEDIVYDGSTYRQYGLPRALQPSDIKIIGQYRNVFVGVDASEPDNREVIYLYYEHGTCKFQPYLKA